MSEPEPQVLEIRPPPPGAKGERIVMALTRFEAAEVLLRNQVRGGRPPDFRAVAEQLQCSFQTLYKRPGLRQLITARPRRPRLGGGAKRRRTKSLHAWDRED